MSARIKILCLLFVLYNFRASAQLVTPAKHGLKEFSIKDKKLGPINFYVDTTNFKKKAPLFIEINGSGGMPLCLYVKGENL